MISKIFSSSPEYLWPILGAYLDVVREYTADETFIPGPSLRKSRRAAAFSLQAELSAQGVGESKYADFVTWACHKMDLSKPHNMTLYALIKFVPTYLRKPEGSEEWRRSYLEGEL